MNKKEWKILANDIAAVTYPLWIIPASIVVSIYFFPSDTVKAVKDYRASIAKRANQ